MRDNQTTRWLSQAGPHRSSSRAASELATEHPRLAAAVLARAGDIAQTQKLADELQKQNPMYTKIVGYWLPTIRAAIELNRRNPSKAIAILEEAAPYELGVPGHSITNGATCPKSRRLVQVTRTDPADPLATQLSEMGV